MKLKEGWKNRSDEAVKEFLRGDHEGHGHPSRLKAITLLEGMHSVLDVGCGTGVMFELLQVIRPEIYYVGMDVTERFIEEARRRHASYADRFLVRSLFELDSLQRNFDAVLCRHILEHLPDYIPAVQNMYARAERKLIVIFYLPPRPLRWGRKRDEKFEKGYYTHTYDLGKFMEHVLNELKPPPAEVRIHPRQGTSHPSLAWADRGNIIYEIVRGASTSV
jgi:SAM-dependent methyltransferase